MTVFERVSNTELREFFEPDTILDRTSYENKQNVLKKVYLILFIIYVVVGITSLVIVYFLRNWYIIRQRNFKLTFLNGIFAFISGFITLLVQIIKLPCSVSLYTSNVINPFYSAIFLSRSLRIVLLYRYNIFKVTEIRKKNKFKLRETFVEREPNNYLPRIYRKVDYIIYFVIAIPTIITFIITIILHLFNTDKCSWTWNANATEQLKSGLGVGKLFLVAQYFGWIYAITMLFMVYFLSKVKDSSKYGVKFECISTIILIVVITLINAYINTSIEPLRSKYFNIKSEVMTSIRGNQNLYNSKMDERINICHDKKVDICKFPSKLIILLYDYTKGGRVLFCLVTMYMIFSSIILPCIKCWNSKREKNKYFHEPTSSIQYFYKVLNSPPLIEELRNIAIKELSVENVLFWENYQILQKMVYRYQIEYKKAERVGNPRLVSQYDFEGYYQQQIQSYSVSSMDDYSYDPNMPVPNEIMPYYINFYHTFIDSLGPAAVNISGAAIKHIYSELCTYPTIGMFDNAKNDIVEMMFTSIFPILLRQNKQLRSGTFQY